jgi:putative hydrolase of HD superfamily
MKIQNILQFIHEAEKLKKELRHSWLSDGRQESVAEHCWRVSLMAITMAPQLTKNLDLLKTLKMVAIHDISEVFVGDMPAFSNDREKHRQFEKEAMAGFLSKHDFPAAKEIFELWEECEAGITLEAKFVKALDKLEVRIQHIEAPISTWNEIEYPRSQFASDKFCDFNDFLSEFNKLQKAEAKEKIIKESDRDINEVLKEAEELNFGRS